MVIYRISSNNSLRNVPGGEERGETDVFAGYSNNSRTPSINCLPRIIAPPPSRPLSPSSVSQFIPSLSSWSGIWSSKTDQWRFKLIWNTLKAHVQFWCDNFYIYWDNKTKHLGYDFQWAIFEIIALIIAFPGIIAPFWCEKRNNRHRLLFEEIRYFFLV